MQATSATASPYPPPPPGYVPAGPHSYAPNHSAGASSPGSSAEPYDYSAAIDPALEGAGTPQLQNANSSYEGAQEFKQSLDNATPYPTNASGQNHRGKAPLLVMMCNSRHKVSIFIDTIIPAKRTKIDDLFVINGVPPPPSASTGIIDNEEIKNIYNTVYAPGIDKFLETSWFRLKGLDHLLKDRSLYEQFAILLARYKIDQHRPDYFQFTAATQSLEASFVWSLMGLCRQVANTPNSTNGQINHPEVDDGVKDAVARLEVFEKLVSGEYLDTESLPQPDDMSNGTALEEQLKYRERQFWRLMHTFLTIRDDEASSAKEIDDTIGSCRTLLDSRENRDVVYSIAIARHVGQRMAEFPDNLQQPTSNDEQDARTKLFVAKKFIEDEANGKGTNQVIQRLCGMAMRSWTVRR